MTGMTDWGASNRKDRFEFWLCDPFTLDEIERLDVDASKSSISWDMDSDPIYSGTIAAMQPVTRDRLIRVRHTVKVGKVSRTDTIATMFVQNAPVKALYGSESRSATCYSTLLRLTNDKLDSDFSRPAGYNVVQAIRDLVESVGGRVAVSDPNDDFNSREFGKPIWFELEENRMDVVRTIASWIDCEIGCDGDGVVTLSPAISPEDKHVAYRFMAGRNCVYVPGAESDDMGSEAANKIVAYYTDGTDTDRVVVELGEDSEFSFARCGRYQTDFLEINSKCTHDALERKAKAHLFEKSGERKFYIIEHVSIPGLKVGDVVEYENDSDFAEPVKERCVVAQMDMKSLTPGAKCVTKIRTF